MNVCALLYASELSPRCGRHKLRFNLLW